MKKRLYFISTILLAATALSLSSCLKDPRYVDFSKAGNVVDMPFSGQGYFGSDAITEAPAEDENGTIVRQFAVNVATANPPTTDTKVTLAVDFSLVDAYNALGGPVTYEALPAEAYSFTTTEVTVPAGKQYAITSVTFYKNLIDPSKSYMLPIKIASTTGGYTISGNLGIHYYHFIGNDFAGVHSHRWDRWVGNDSTKNTKDQNYADAGDVTFFPVTPTEFTVTTAYYTQPPYTVDFVKTGSTYSHFTVDFTAQDIQDYFVAPGGGVTLAQHPLIVPKSGAAYVPDKEYTFAEAQDLLRFYYTTGSRAVIDYYYKK